MKKYVIACDLDNFIFDVEYEFCERFGYGHREMYNFFERYPEHADLISEFVATPSTYSDLTPIFGGIHFVNTAIKKGMGIVFMTGRPKSTAKVTLDLLKTYGLSDIPVFHTQDKGGTIYEYNNCMCVEDTEIKMLVDDCPQNLQDLSVGVVGLCWEQPWNMGVYPRATYDPISMTIEIKNSDTESWKEMWR